MVKRTRCFKVIRILDKITDVKYIPAEIEIYNKKCVDKEKLNLKNSHCIAEHRYACKS